MWFQILKIEPGLEHELTRLKANIASGIGNVPEQQRRIQEIESKITGGEIARTGALIPQTPMTQEEIEETALRIQNKEAGVPDFDLEAVLESMKEIPPPKKEQILSRYPKFRQILDSPRRLRMAR